MTFDDILEQAIDMLRPRIRRPLDGKNLLDLPAPSAAAAERSRTADSNLFFLEESVRTL